MAQVRELEQAVQLLFSGQAGHGQQRDIEARLEKLRTGSDAIRFGCEVLRDSRVEYARWFACTAVEHGVRHQWVSLSAQERASIREFLFAFLLGPDGAASRPIASKVAKIIVDIAKFDWPSADPDFFGRVIRSAVSEESNFTREMGLQMLLILVEEFASESGTIPLPSRRTEELRQLLRRNIKDINSVITRTLSRGLQDPRILSGAHQDSCVALTFKILAQLMSWVPLDAYVDRALMEVIFKYMAATTSEHAVQAVTCVNELLDKNFTPPDMEGFVVEVSLAALQTLQRLDSDPSLIERCTDGFVNQYSQLLAIFLRKHLKRAERSPKFPFDEFFRLFTTYTMRLTDAEDFVHCLDTWAAYVQHVNEQAAEEPERVERSVAVLCELMKKLLHRLLWSRSAEYLEAIDDESQQECEVPTSDSNISASHKIKARSTETELEWYLGRITKLVGEIAILPNPITSPGFRPLFMEVGNLLGASLPRLETAISSGAGAGNSEGLAAVSDVNWLFRVATHLSGMLAYEPHLTGLFDPTLQYVHWAIDILRESNKRRLFTSGPRFMQLHVTLLNFLASLNQWLRVLGDMSGAVVQLPSAAVASEAARAAESIAKVAREFPNLLDTTLNLAIQSLDSMLTPPPEPVAVAAIDLINAVGTRVAPASFFDIAPMRTLRQGLQRYAAGLPLEARCLLFIALSQSITRPVEHRPVNDPEWQARRAIYDEIVGGVAKALTSSINELVAAGDLVALCQRAEGCRPHLGILAELCRSVMTSPLALKAFMAEPLLPTLPATVRLTECLLSPAEALGRGQASEEEARRLRHALLASLGTARDSLDYLVAILQSFPKQAGRDACAETITRLINLFSVQSTTDSLAQSGGGGVLLLLKVLRLISVLMDEPTNFFKDLYPQVLTLCLNNLPHMVKQLTEAAAGSQNAGGASSTPEAVLDLLEVQYELIHKVLRQHWRNYFFDESMHHGRNSTKAFKSQESRDFFFRAMELLLASFTSKDIPPNLFRRNLNIFEDLNVTHRLYEQQDFCTAMRPAFISTLLRVLVNKSHQLLEEELLATVYGLAAIDLDHFYSTVLPDFTREYIRSAQGQDPSASAVHELLASTINQAQDIPSFALNFHRFANDLRFHIAAPRA